jgi:uncharacterized membrane protein YccC
MTHRFKNWLQPRFDLVSIEHTARTAIAATASLAAAYAVGLPDAYWAPITSMVVTQSTLGATWTVSRQRFAGTALGAVLGALLSEHIGAGVAVFMASIFAVGPLCAVLHLDRTAYRFAGITLAIVLLASHDKTAWSMAINRFLEVSVGIAAGLILTALWPEKQRPAV